MKNNLNFEINSYRKITSKWSVVDRGMFLLWKQECYFNKNKEICYDWSKNCNNNGIYLIEYSEHSEKFGMEHLNKFFICNPCFEKVKKSVGKPIE